MAQTGGIAQQINQTGLAQEEVVGILIPRSQWLAIAHHGLNAKIMRVGNLSACQKDGEFQINFNTNNFLATLRAYVVIGMIPYEALDKYFEFSPIDPLPTIHDRKDWHLFHPN